MSTPCNMEEQCCNSPMFGEAHAKCALCRLSPDNLGRDMAHFWNPIPVARKMKVKHPQLVEEKRVNKNAKHFASLLKKRNKDRKKRKVSRQAQQAEKKTEAVIIHATKNSGRRNKDGDHVSAGVITLDTKLQTTRENPVILLGELEKVRGDAVRAGKWIGGLVLRNRHGVGVVVFKEEDYAELAKRLLYPEERTNEQECRSNGFQQMGPKIPGIGEAGS